MSTVIPGKNEFFLRPALSHHFMVNNNRCRAADFTKNGIFTQKRFDIGCN
jgi:hypothetical protein